MYKSGDIVQGKVTDITNFGFFFITEDKWKGLVHISEISDKYIYSIADHFDKDQKIEVVVLTVDDAKQQIRASYKQANPNAIVETKTFNSKKDFAKPKKSLDSAVTKTLNKIKKQR